MEKKNISKKKQTLIYFTNKVNTINTNIIKNFKKDVFKVIYYNYNKKS